MITDSYLRQRGNEQKLMKVCIVAEGCYPYVVGGVSGWINSMIKSFPNVEFILLAIVADRSCRGKFVYELPENLTQVYEVYLDENADGRQLQLAGKQIQIDSTTLNYSCMPEDKIVKGITALCQTIRENLR